MHQLLERSTERKPDRIAFRRVDCQRVVAYAEAVAAS